MKKLESCNTDNCIPVKSSCVFWNGGDIEYLGICDGESINNLLIDIIEKLKAIAGEDLSQFDVDALLTICNQQAPTEITLISILNLIKNNQVCLKDFINELSDQIADITGADDVTVNLKCYDSFDNQGNSLSITRETLDQLVIDNLCSQKIRIETLEGKVVSLQSQINNLDVNPTVEEPEFVTCIDSASKATSEQAKSIATALCALQNSIGLPVDIASALANTPADDNVIYGLIPGWNLTPSSWAENYGNLLLKVAKMEADLKDIKDNCCAITCDDVQVGFGTKMNEDGDGVILQFTSGAGTKIPAGFTDKGSTIRLTDSKDNFTTADIVITNNAELEILIDGLDLTGDLEIDVTAVLGSSTLTCQKCIHKSLSNIDVCEYCETLNGSPTGTVTVISRPIDPNTTTTTTQATTTTTTTILT